MARFFKKRIENKGLPPGSFIFIGTKKVEQPTVEYIAYNPQELSESEFLKQDDIPKDDPQKIQWYNITGLHNVQFMQHVAQRLNIHSLVMESVMNTGQRAKFVEFDDFIFISIKMLRFNESTLRVSSEQVSFVLKETSLITFQEEPGDTFEPIRTRLRNSAGNIRKSGPDYLTYTLLDSIIDNYIYLIENLGEKIDDLELQVLDNPKEEVLNTINIYKRELHFILKVARPANELFYNLLRSETPFIKKSKVLHYYKDAANLLTHALESVEAYRVVLNDYLQIYHSNLSSRMNGIMKILTIFSAIFIPLTFLAGIYGMNFEHLPELHYKHSYSIFWLVSVLLALGMLIFFKRKKWF